MAQKLAKFRVQKGNITSGRPVRTVRKTASASGVCVESVISCIAKKKDTKFLRYVSMIDLMRPLQTKDSFIFISYCFTLSRMHLTKTRIPKISIRTKHVEAMSKKPNKLVSLRPCRILTI